MDTHLFQYDCRADIYLLTPGRFSIKGDGAGFMWFHNFTDKMLSVDGQSVLMFIRNVDMSRYAFAMRTVASLIYEQLSVDDYKLIFVNRYTGEVKIHGRYENSSIDLRPHTSVDINGDVESVYNQMTIRIDIADIIDDFHDEFDWNPFNPENLLTELINSESVSSLFDSIDSNSITSLFESDSDTYPVRINIERPIICPTNQISESMFDIIIGEIRLTDEGIVSANASIYTTVMVIKNIRRSEEITKKFVDHINDRIYKSLVNLVTVHKPINN